MKKGLCFEYKTERYKDLMNVENEVFEQLVNTELYYKVDADRVYKVVNHETNQYTMLVLVPNTRKNLGQRKELLEGLGFSFRKDIRALN